MRDITFLKDYGFAEDGIRTTHFKAGETRQVTDSCADSAIQQGAAFDVERGFPSRLQASATSETVEVPMPKAKPAPANKAKAAPANKGR